MGEQDDFTRLAERYHGEAAACHQMAEAAISPVDRDAWLQLAKDWTDMAREAEARSAELGAASAQ